MTTPTQPQSAATLDREARLLAFSAGWACALEYVAGSLNEHTRSRIDAELADMLAARRETAERWRRLDVAEAAGPAAYAAERAAQGLTAPERWRAS